MYNPFGFTANHNTSNAPAPAPAGAGTASAAGNAGQASSQVQAAPAAIPFYKAAKWHQEIADTFSGVAYGGVFKPQQAAYGWLARDDLRIIASGGSGGNAVAAADAPWNALGSVVVKNPQGRQLVAADGYSLKLVADYSGMSLFKQSGAPSWSAMDSSGNFDFTLPIWHEFGQYGRGCLPNTNQSATYKVEVTFAPATTVYSTPPTTVPTLSGYLGMLGRLAPAPTDLFGRAQMQQPPLAGIYQEISLQAAVVKNGLNTFFSNRVGNVIRMLLLIWRDSSGSRSGAVSGGTFPALGSHIVVKWDTTVLYDTTPEELQDLSYQKTGIVPDAGVIPLLFTDDEDHLAVGEDGGQYIPTLGSTKLEIDWTSTTGGGSFTLVTVDIVSPDGGVGVTQ
jgi:hypothetical protein